MDYKPVTGGSSQAPTALALQAPAQPSRNKTPWPLKVWRLAKWGASTGLWWPQGAGIRRVHCLRRVNLRQTPPATQNQLMFLEEKGNVQNLMGGRTKQSETEQRQNKILPVKCLNLPLPDQEPDRNNALHSSPQYLRGVRLPRKV